MLTMVFPTLADLWNYLKGVDKYKYDVNLEKHELTGTFSQREINYALNTFQVQIKNDHAQA